jgi:phosphoribosylformimino-5-aminoimidazole carboxamide ribonucleotide (ProFAR) isomerase
LTTRQNMKCLLVEQAGKYIRIMVLKTLHIVDLDGALTGETVNLRYNQEIVS